MKNDFQHIEELYRDAITEQKLKPSASFKARISLLFLFMQFRKILLILFILFGMIIGGYYGYLAFADSNYNDVDYDLKSSIVMDNSDVEDNVQIVEDIKHDEKEASILHNNFKDSSITVSLIVENVFIPTENELTINKSVRIEISNIKYKKTFNICSNSEIETVFRTIPASINIDSAKVENDEIEESNMNLKGNLRKDKLFSLSLYVSPTVTKAIVKTNGDVYNEYFNQRNNNESAAVSWSFGGDLQVHLNNWFVQAGINYSVYRNNKSYNYSYQLLDSANSYFNYDTIWVWIYDPPNLEYPVMVGIDTTWVSVYDNISIVDDGYNEWSYMEIPVLVGYKINYKKFDFDISMGISFGFLLNYKGSLPKCPDADGVEKLVHIDGSINKTMYNYIMRMGVSYNFKNNWSVFAQPYFKQNLQSVFNRNYPVNQRFNAFGLNVGLRVSF